MRTLGIRQVVTLKLDSIMPLARDRSIRVSVGFVVWAP